MKRVPSLSVCERENEMWNKLRSIKSKDLYEVLEKKESKEPAVVKHKRKYWENINVGEIFQRGNVKLNSTCIEQNDFDMRNVILYINMVLYMTEFPVQCLNVENEAWTF